MAETRCDPCCFLRLGPLHLTPVMVGFFSSLAEWGQRPSQERHWPRMFRASVTGDLMVMHVPPPC